jgi:hypothetical protein
MESFEELLRSNIYTQDVLINLFEKKALIDKKEFFEEIKRQGREQPKK